MAVRDLTLIPGGSRPEYYLQIVQVEPPSFKEKMPVLDEAMSATKENTWADSGTEDELSALFVHYTSTTSAARASSAKYVSTPFANVSKPGLIRRPYC